MKNYTRRVGSSSRAFPLLNVYITHFKAPNNCYLAAKVYLELHWHYCNLHNLQSHLIVSWTNDVTCSDLLHIPPSPGGLPRIKALIQCNRRLRWRRKTRHTFLGRRYWQTFARSCTELFRLGYDYVIKDYHGNQSRLALNLFRSLTVRVAYLLCLLPTHPQARAVSRRSIETASHCLPWTRGWDGWKLEINLLFWICLMTSFIYRLQKTVAIAISPRYRLPDFLKHF